MGTFHHDKSELHGITVVVELEDGEVYVGRCDDMDDQRILLMDVDLHRDGDDGRSTAEYLELGAIQRGRDDYYVVRGIEPCTP